MEAPHPIRDAARRQYRQAFRRLASLIGIAFVLLLRSHVASATAGAQLPWKSSSGTRVDYTIEAKLDADEHVIVATETVSLTNGSRAPLTELYLHLYLNAFKNDKTVFNRSPLSRGRSGAATTGWGHTDIRQVLVEGQDLWPNHEFSTDADETDVRIPLPHPVAPNSTLRLEIQFEAKLPRIVERTGYASDYHFVGQWFPKLAKLRDDGTWAHFDFHPHAEFFADFGDYDVVLDVPSNYVVGASGARQSQELVGDRKRVRHFARRVHDFAWTAWPGFLVNETTVEGTAVRLLYPAGHERNRDATLDAVRHALPHFNRAYGVYPYETLTIVHPPDYAADSGGMEYPTLITTGGPWFSTFISRWLWLLTIHELGHQWFYGLVATNEEAFPFLDEGLTSFAEGEALSSRFGASSALDWPGLSISVLAAQRAASARSSGVFPVASSAREFASFGQIADLVYNRTSTILATLDRVSSGGVVSALGDYAQQQRFEHPSPETFFGHLDRQLGNELGEVARQAFSSRAGVDYYVDALVSSKLTSPDSDSEISDPPDYVTQLHLGRRGELHFPVDIELYLEDGSTQRLHTDGRDTNAIVEYHSPVAVIGAVVDPDLQIPLDDNLLNNGHVPAPNRPFLLRTLDRLGFWLGFLLDMASP